GGVLLANYAPILVNAWQLMPSNVYWVDYLPVKIMGLDLLKVSFVALLMSFLATLYPAHRASKTIIATALRYE
ncbi:MAG: ABC transporter, partial [Legionella sp. 21-45-4]